MGTVAPLLGREDCGLNSEELALCDMLVSIPTSSEYPVMNLSHSAAVLFYELSQDENPDASKVEMASGESLSLLQEKNILLLLAEVGYPLHKVEFTLLMLRRILGRGGNDTKRSSHSAWSDKENSLEDKQRWMMKTPPHGTKMKCG